MFNLDGKVVVITGGAGLLGRQHARAVTAIGGTAVLLDVSESVLNRALEELEETAPGRYAGFAVDITDRGKLEMVLQRILEAQGACDVLINNAANNPKVEDKKVTSDTLLENFPLEIWNDDVRVGLTGAFLCTQVFGAHMAGRKSGNIINISSDLGIIAPDQRIYNPGGSRTTAKPVSYSVIKHGLIGLTRYVATYWADAGIRCNALAPAGVFTSQDEDFVQRLTSLIPMGRMACADEYQGAIQFLASDASSYMTGQVLVMDGGRSVW